MFERPSLLLLTMAREERKGGHTPSARPPCSAKHNRMGSDGAGPRMPQSKQLLVRFVLPPLLIFAGCAVGPDYQTPDKQTPDAWNSPLDTGLAGGEADVTEWWDSFGDPMLADLIARAAEGNLDLRMAVLRIRQARALRGVAAGALLPSLTGNSSYQRSKLSGGGLLGAAQGGGAGSSFSETFARGMTTGAISQGITNASPARRVSPRPWRRAS